MSTSQSQQSVEKLLLKETETYQKIFSAAEDMDGTTMRLVGGMDSWYNQIPYPLGRQTTNWRIIIFQRFSHMSALQKFHCERAIERTHCALPAPLDFSPDPSPAAIASAVPHPPPGSARPPSRISGSLARRTTGGRCQGPWLPAARRASLRPGTPAVGKAKRNLRVRQPGPGFLPAGRGPDRPLARGPGMVGLVARARASRRPEEVLPRGRGPGPTPAQVAGRSWKSQGRRGGADCGSL